MKINLPKKKRGRATGPRTLSGKILDIATASAIYGGTEKTWRARVRSGLVPYRRWSGRIIFIRSELDSFFAESLPGLTVDQAQANLEAKRGEL